MSTTTTFFIAEAEHVVRALARARHKHQRDMPTPEAMAYREWVGRRRELDAEYEMAQRELQRLINAREAALRQENTIGITNT